MSATLDDVYAGRARLDEVPGYFHCPFGIETVINQATCEAFQKRPILCGTKRDGDHSFRSPCPLDCQSPWNKRKVGKWSKRQKNRLFQGVMR